MYMCYTNEYTNEDPSKDILDYNYYLCDIN